ncbi:MAG: flippase-like domain-containing protein [Chloroflexi bacterium]|nr:flippase-like domain-containing protein [Chloroflexota bacterium]
MFKSKQFIIGIAVSLVFLAWALSKEDLGAVWQGILAAHYWALIPALALYFVGVWVRAVRWRILLKPIAPKVSLGKTFEVVVIGYMANDVLPARIGELVRAYVLSMREDVRKTATLATILVERIFDGLIMIGFAAVVVLIVTTMQSGALQTGPEHQLGTLLSERGGLLGVLAALLILALLVFVTIASSRSRAERAIGFTLRFVPGRLHERVEKLAGSFIDGLGSLRSASGLASVFGLSVVAWLFEAGMYYVLGTWGFDLRGFSGGPLPFYAYVLATAIANLSTLIPQAPGFIGVFDAIAKVVLVGAFGVASQPATSYVLVLHAALLIPISILGFVYLARESLSWRDLTNLEEQRLQASTQAHEMEGPLSDIELAQDGKLPTDEEVVSKDEAARSELRIHNQP